MRDIFWLLADLQTRATFLGLLEKTDCHRKLCCSKFKFNVDLDLAVHYGHDPGIWKNPLLVLDSKRQSHERAIIVLDNDWDGSPGPAKIREDIEHKVLASGWTRDRFEIIVIEPELEQWIWQDNVHVETALEHHGPLSLRDYLSKHKISSSGQLVEMHQDDLDDPVWPVGVPKPPRPKEAIEAIFALKRLGPCSPVFNEIARTVGIAHCQDQAFLKLVATIKRWYPVE